MQWFAENTAAQYGTWYRREDLKYRAWLRDAGMTGWICTILDKDGKELAAFHGEDALDKAMKWTAQEAAK